MKIVSYVCDICGEKTNADEFTLPVKKNSLKGAKGNSSLLSFTLEPIVTNWNLCHSCQIEISDKIIEMHKEKEKR